jgi:hypothetical protein
MVRFLIFLLGMLTTRSGRVGAASFRAEDPDGWRGVEPDRWTAEERDRWRAEEPDRWRGEEPDGWTADEPDDWVEAVTPRALNGAGSGYSWPVLPESPPSSCQSARRYGAGSRRDGRNRTRPVAKRRRIPVWFKWAAAIALAGLIFRKAIAFVVLAALSAALHLIGLNVHLPSIKFAWPWQSIAAGSTTDTEVGPWVLQKIEGISRPALGTETFNFVFTHKVTKNIGFWPCWYASTFYAVGHASATVDLNPGPAWWTPATSHYQLQVLSRPRDGKPGRVAVAVVLPQPQLPQSVHDITVDNTLSRPLDTQHSWTYPGFGCGAVIKPQFSVSVLYGQAQSLAYYQATHDPKVTQPLISAAEAEAAQIIRYNFIQPTVNALGYSLARFSIGWSGAP